PAAGTVLGVGSQPLSTTFTPDDTVNYTTVHKTVSIDVQPATLVISANDASKTYGTANPIFTGSITGTENGDIFTESFSTSAITLSNAGIYPIVPAAAGVHLGNYVQ